MKRILFDGTIFQDGLEANCSRSGLFMASFELFRALCQRLDKLPDLYVEPMSYDRVKRFVDTLDFAKNIHFVIGDDGYTAFLNQLNAFVAPPMDRRGGAVARLLWMSFECVKAIFAALAPICRRASRIWRAMHYRLRYSGLFSSFYAEPTYLKGCGLRHFTVLYDTIPVLFPQFYPGMEGAGAPLLALVKSMTKKDWGFAISECTKKDFLKFSSELVPDHIKVIPLGAAERFHPCADKVRIASVRAKYGIPRGRPYFLSLSTIEPRKNIPFALKAFAEFTKTDKDTLFVIAGSAWSSYRAQWEATLAQYESIRDRIILPGYVADEDMSPLYADAYAFVYLSLYEGFGLPPLEAMQCGCPVLCSNASSLPEVVGDAAITVAPDDFEGAVDAMRRIASDATLRLTLSQRGFERAKCFSWKRAADVIVETMRTAGRGAFSQVFAHWDVDRETREMLADRVWRNRPGDRRHRVAVFSPMPPEKTGVADFSLKLFMSRPEWFDVFAKVDTRKEYMDALRANGRQYNVIPFDYYRSRLNSPSDYAAQVFVIGNSTFHSQAFDEAVRTKGRPNRYLYLHEALIMGAMADWMEARGVTPGAFLGEWYPEKGDLQSCSTLASERDVFCRKHGVYGVRAMIALTGITDLIINNRRCRDLLLSDLMPAERKKIKIHELFLPIERITTRNPIVFPAAKGEPVVGSFGIPHTTKGTALIVKAVRQLNEMGFPCHLLLAGYGADGYMQGLSPEDRKYCLPFEDTSDITYFMRLMSSVTVAVQLRMSQHGESSGCLSQLLGIGVPLVSNRGFVDSVFEPFCVCTSENPTVDEIAQAIRTACQKRRDSAACVRLASEYSALAAAGKLYNWVGGRNN